MARVDDYFNAKKISVAALEKKDFQDLTRFSLFEKMGENKWRVPFLNRTYAVSFPDFTFTDLADAAREVPIQEQVLALHYLEGVSDLSVSGNWVAYREIKDAAFYNSAFLKRTAVPLKSVFGKNPGALTASGEKLGAGFVDFGDVGLEFAVFPKIPVRYILWAGDDEFEPEASVLFDDTAGRILSAEDLAWLAGMVVYRLMALAG